MADLKRKLLECVDKLAADEAEIKRLEKSCKTAREESDRLVYEMRLQALRERVESITLEPTDRNGRAVRVALLVDQALRELGDVDTLTFTLPIGEPGGDPHAYYDDRYEPLSVHEAEARGIYVKATWNWEGTADRVARINVDGSVAIVGQNKDQLTEEAVMNVLKDDPAEWVAFLCEGKPKQ